MFICYFNLWGTWNNSALTRHALCLITFLKWWRWEPSKCWLIKELQALINLNFNQVFKLILYTWWLLVNLVVVVPIDILFLRTRSQTISSAMCSQGMWHFAECHIDMISHSSINLPAVAICALMTNVYIHINHPVFRNQTLYIISSQIL